MKTVFTDVSHIAHLWANKQQDEAKNPHRNFYFNNDTIFSYGRHFPIAKHIRHEGKKAVLFTERSYSVTTSSHINTVRQASNHLNLIYCFNPESTHEQNFESWKNSIESISPKLEKAKKPEIYLSQIENVGERAKKYAEFFNITIPETLQAALSITSKDAWKEYAGKKAEAEEKQRIETEKKNKIEHAKELKKWRAGKLHRLYRRDGWDYLRLNKELNRIETTQAVQIPVQKAKVFYNVIQREIKRGGCVGCPVKLMQWDVQEINKEFILIGCHKISMKEVEKMAKIIFV